MSRSSFASLAVIVAAVATRTTAAPTTVPAIPRTPPFVFVLERDWATFDADGDGTLSVAEIDHAVVDPAIQADDAAIAAALKIAVRGAKVVLPPLTKAYFDQYEVVAKRLRAKRLAERAATKPAETAIDDALHGDPRADTASTQPDAIHRGPATMPATFASDRPSPDWDILYLLARRRIYTSGKIVWPENGPSLQNMRQGPLGDCYFVSVVGAIVARDAGQIERMVTPLEGGKFRVAFPTTRPITVGPLTPAQLAISSTTQGDGIWLAVLEQAFGRYRLSAKPTTQETIEAADAIAHGGSTGPTISALTGHGRRQIRFLSTLERRAAQQDAMLTVLRSQLTAAVRDKRLITTGVAAPPTTQPTTGTLPKIPTGINTNHAYAILNYDAAADTIELWNPHGQKFQPSGPPGLVNGYVTDHGRFTVPLVEGYQFLSSITIETDAPATQP